MLSRQSVLPIPRPKLHISSIPREKGHCYFVQNDDRGLRGGMDSNDNPWGHLYRTDRAGGPPSDLIMLSVAKELHNLDKSIRREYDEAVESDGDLVARETKFLDFLRTEDMDAAKAAKRLALYWKYRRQLFQERWLRPMTQTGHGALSPSDMVMLRSGYTIGIKRSVGGPVGLVDISRLPGRYAYDTNSRIVFYMATVMTDESFQVEGMTIVQLVTSAPRPPQETNPEGWKMFREALPLRVKQLIVAQAYEPWKDALLDSLSYQVACAAGFKTQIHPNRIQGSSIKSVLKQLEAKGIMSHCLPPSHGGSYNYTAFGDWMQMRLSLEELMGSAPIAVNMRFGRQPLKRQRTHATASGSDSKDSVVLSPRYRREKAERDERKESSATLRRSLDTEIVLPDNKPRPMTMVEQRVHLERKNRMLREDNRRLESLLEQARLLVNGTSEVASERNMPTQSLIDNSPVDSSQCHSQL